MPPDAPTMLPPHLILVPGLLCDNAVWHHQSRELASLSDITIADHGSLDSFSAMATAILDIAPPRFAIAGHSMGGRVLFEVFRQAPKRVAGIALMDTACTPRKDGVDGQQEADQRYRLLKKAQTEGMRAMGIEWARPMVHPDRLSDEELMTSILDMISRKTPEIFAAQIKALLDRPDARGLLSEVRCPALVLVGRQDSWSVLEHHKEMAAALPDGRLVVIEDCGHMSTMERPAEVTGALRRWLTSL
jgi:pimeloyl-ACP methyl ester carboxylesterase